MPNDLRQFKPRKKSKILAPRREVFKLGYFKVMEPCRSDIDIVGMSGCPVFAFCEQPDRDVQVVVCAMQSSWLPMRRVLATVDLRFTGRQLRAVVKTSQEGS